MDIRQIRLPEYHLFVQHRSSIVQYMYQEFYVVHPLVSDVSPIEFLEFDTSEVYSAVP